MRGLAEKALVFPVELRGAFVAHGKPRARRIHPFRQPEALRFKKTQPLVELQRTQAGHFLEMPVKGGSSHVHAPRQLLHLQGRTVVVAQPRHGLGYLRALGTESMKAAQKIALRYHGYLHELAAVYADQAMGFTPDETILLVLLVNITAAIGAFAFGYVEDRIGHKNALIVTLFIWIAMVGVAYFAQTKALFWVAANLAGIAMGSSQSAGRALVGVLAPEKDRAAFYSFWNMALWVANIIGPMTYGLITWMTGNDQRLALLCTGMFFVVGLIFLLPMKLSKTKENFQKI